MLKQIMLLGLFSVTVTTANAGSVVSDFPSDPGSSEKYIIYLHGSAEESDGASDKYEAAVQAIAEGSATVISEIRGDTNPNAYSLKLKEQVDGLISKGASPENITISGYSKGAVIALATAGAINNPTINYVLLAGCSDYLNDKYSVDASKASGRILAIYDSGDDKFGSCEGVIQAGDGVTLKEKELNSGKGHKVFRIPKGKFIDLWRDPLLDWAGA